MKVLYNDVTPGFVSIPGFINRVDIRETVQDFHYRFRPQAKDGFSVGDRPFWFDTISTTPACASTLTTSLTSSIRGQGQTVIILRPYQEFRERLRPQDFCFYGFSVYCAPGALGNQDYHEHESGATFQTGYLKWATLAAGYYWGDGTNFVAEPDTPPAAPTPYNLPFLARQDSATASLTLRPMKPLKIENTYLFDRLRTTNSTYLFEQGQFPGAGRGIFNDHILRSKWNWQFTPQLSLRLILQYNDLLAGTPGVGSPYTYLPTQKEFNADFLLTYLVHPGTAIYVGYNSDLQNLNVVPGTPAVPGGVTNTAKGY